MTDDLELARLRERLDALASAVEPLDDDDLTRIARAATATAPRRARRRVPVLPAAAAAVAASAAVAAVAVSGIGDDSGGARADTGTTSLVSFPEGSAIRLLTSNREGESR